ncbi:hypothetical protein N0V90_005528 [Kalmusia sp. IMI 367209]|nr:hypothetical protein N0V90_005528 [Kalmusia sp. IMI 367209]
MRYARSTSRIDGLRFTAPQDPLPVNGVVDATEFGPLCVGTNNVLLYEFGGKWSEDCLFANVLAPTNATVKSKLPVFVFVQGGGFNNNGNANLNGSDLVHASDKGMVVVNFNYRVGPYGFLASKEIVANKTLSLNNGLKDQRQLLQWVQKHIDKFGGDPQHVTLGGASAGAGSVVLQLTAYGGRNDKLFHAATIESPATPTMRNATESQWQYNALLKQTGCKDLGCLQTMDAVSFQEAVRNLNIPFPGGKNPPIYPFNPTLDYDFIRDYTYNEFQKGHFVKVPTIIGDTTNEGMIFTSKSVSSSQNAYTFIADQFTNLDTGDQKKIGDVWQGPTDLTKDGRWRNVAADIYGHIRYVCPGLNFSSAYAYDGIPTWQYRWNVGPALHVGELMSIWYNGTQASQVFMHAYWISFIRSYDPNKHIAEFWTQGGTKLTSPKWDTFGNTGNGKRLLFDDKNVVKIEDVSDQEWNRCNVIADMGLQLDQ